MFLLIASIWGRQDLYRSSTCVALKSTGPLNFEWRLNVKGKRRSINPSPTSASSLRGSIDRSTYTPLPFSYSMRLDSCTWIMTPAFSFMELHTIRFNFSVDVIEQISNPLPSIVCKYTSCAGRSISINTFTA